MTFRTRIFNSLVIAAQTAPATTVAGSPTAVGVADLFPSVVLGWGSPNLHNIQLIVNAINNAMFILSKGQADFNKFRVANFAGEASNVPDQYLLAIVRFAKLIFNDLLTNGGKAYVAALTPKDKASRIAKLNGMLLAANIPDGSINTQLAQKIGGSMKSILTNALNAIK